MKESVSKKTLVIAGVSIIGFLISILVIVWIFSLFKPNYISYEKFEEKVITATKKFYSDNPTLLPINDGEYSILYSTLQDNNYISPLNELLEDGDKCTIEIKIIKYEENFSYIPYLNCPGSYETKELYKVITDNNSIVISGDGLYRANDNSLYYKGDIKNNYLMFGSIDNEKNILWRIISIDSDNNIKIIRTTATEETYTWDDRYNINKSSTTGYNDFEVSRLKETLQSFGTSELILTDALKSKLVAKNLCVGKRNIKDTDNSGNIECSIMSEDKYLFGALSTYEYLRASLDENCNKISDKSCINYNYLPGFFKSTWAITANNDTTHKVFYFSNSEVSDSTASNSKKIMVVTNLNNRVLYKSGNGSLSDPYIIK
ncbi:MAG: hypothetical protein GX758_00070 [Tenericutes bacterium]|nr:hypothetical protein [Mycoplasmatota bacterium]